MNAEVAAWMRRERTDEGYASPPFLAMGDGKSVMWNRQLSVEKFVNPVDRFRAVTMVSQALGEIGAKRLVVGHTPQVGLRFGALRGRGAGRELFWGGQRRLGFARHLLSSTPCPNQP
jgi:hypothetical protein